MVGLSSNLAISSSIDFATGIVSEIAVPINLDRRQNALNMLAKTPLDNISGCRGSAIPTSPAPAPGDREIIIISGLAKAPPWRHKRRLQVRMVPSLTVPFIRRCLAMVLAVGDGRLVVRVEKTGTETVEKVKISDKQTIEMLLTA